MRQSKNQKAKRRVQRTKFRATSPDGMMPFTELPEPGTKEIKNGPKAFDLFEYYTADIIHKKIVYGR